jgi:sulfite reductase (NADPH) flavoprotein alpha-component
MSNATQTTLFTKDNPLMASMKENRLLNKPGSAKETRHFVIDVGGSGLGYTAGDSLGVFPSNEGGSVEALLTALRASGEELVEVPKVEGMISLREALMSRLSIAGPTRKALDSFHQRVTDPAERAELEALLLPEAREKMMDFLANREFVDLLEEFPSARFSAQEFVGLLRRLMPRLYSIASSPMVFPEEIHLTVAVVRYATNARKRLGVCSTYLSERLPLYERVVPVFVASSHFGLPEDESADVIMVGPGTGIAPFRAFIQERVAKKSPGRNWLFFGDQHRETDYLYGDEFEAYLEEGELNRLDLAFSRDQKEKIYVQDRMMEQGAELWQWLKAGSYFYVCGDAKRMAKDVDAALQAIVSLHGAMSPDEAADYVKAMKKEKRYQRDVY